MLNKKNRIADRKLIEKLGKTGNRYRGNCLTFRFFPKNETPSTFAIAISKKIAKRAVDRNRFRRQISEAIRLHLNKLKPNIVSLVIGGSKITEAAYADLEGEVLQFFNSFSADAK